MDGIERITAIVIVFCVLSPLKGSEGVEHKILAVNGIRMHVAEEGQGPVVLLLHGFPGLWYSWRHQMATLAAHGYRAVAPDLRGYGDSDAPLSVNNYTSLHVVGDLIGLINLLGQDKVFVVGHDWGALMAWHLCLFRPEKVKALVTLSVAFPPRNPLMKPTQRWRALYGDDYYIIRFQEPGEMETEFVRVGTETVLNIFLSYNKPAPFNISKDKGLEPTGPIALPSWLPKVDFNHYVDKYQQKGFTGGLNYYRALDLDWELTAPWTDALLKVPAKFTVGDQDLTYNGSGIKEYIHGGGFKKYVPLLEEIVVLIGASHFINEERPAEINTQILDFINKF